MVGSRRLNKLTSVDPRRRKSSFSVLKSNKDINMEYQAISCRSLTTETRVPPHASQCGICVCGQSVTGTAFCVLRVSPLSVIPRMLHARI